MRIPSKLQFRLLNFLEHESTDDRLQGANDEVFIGATGMDSQSIVVGPDGKPTGNVKRAEPIGDVSDDSVRVPWRTQPHVLMEFDLRRDGDWPRSFAVTLLIVEHDNDDIAETFHVLNEKVGAMVKDAAVKGAASAAGSLIGGALGSAIPGIGSAVGAAIGAVVGSVFDEIISEIQQGLANEVFTPRTLIIEVQSPDQLGQHPGISTVQSIEINEKGARYTIEYDWNVSSAGDPFAIQNQDGRIEVFATGLADGAIWHRWQTAPNGPFADWHSLGGNVTQPFAIRNQDGRIELFAIGAGTDRSLWHCWQTTPNGPFADWKSLGGNVTEPFAIQNQDGRIEVFARGMRDGAIWHRWQTAPNGPFADWHRLT